MNSREGLAPRMEGRFMSMILVGDREAVARQVAIISNINVDEVVGYFASTIQRLQGMLVNWDIVSPDQTLETLIEQKVTDLINFAGMSNIIAKLLNASGTLFIGMFTVLFLSFFFLRDRHLLKGGILLFAPDRFQDQVTHILHKTKTMLSRYFLGLLTAMLIMATLITIGLLIALIGLLWPWIAKLGLGRLPGDLIIDKPGFKLFAPFTTMIVISVVLSLIIWLLRR